MKTIDIANQVGVKLRLYPDNQPHVNVQGVFDGDEVRVIAPLRSSLDVMHLLQVSNALDNLFAKKKQLIIPYLMGARFDRLMESGDSVDLRVVADLINSCGFERVWLVDVHSDVALQLIHRSTNITNRFLVEHYTQPNAVLICPDAGAAKKTASYMDWNRRLTDVVTCVKHRDLSNGQIVLRVLEPEKCKGRFCVIIDDICDGGATFLAIAKQIEPVHLTLIVTHGIFSKGFRELEEQFNEIVTSNSYGNTAASKRITTVGIQL